MVMGVPGRMQMVTGGRGSIINAVGSLELWAGQGRWAGHRI